MKSYRILQKTRDTEIRKYPPIKRTVEIMGRSYYLQFPSLVFSWDGHLSVWFAKESDDEVYEVPLPNIEGQDGYICLDHDGRQPKDMDDAIAWFWMNEFNDWLGSEECFRKTFGRFHSWAKLSLEQVYQKLQKPIPMKSILEGEYVEVSYDSDDDFNDNEEWAALLDHEEIPRRRRGGRGRGRGRASATQAKNLAKEVMNEVMDIRKIMGY
jgi:hypothetical protein